MAISTEDANLAVFGDGPPAAERGSATRPWLSTHVKPAVIDKTNKCMKEEQMYEETDDNAPVSTADAPKDPKPGPDPKPTGAGTIVVPGSGTDTRFWDHV